MLSICSTSSHQKNLNKFIHATAQKIKFSSKDFSVNVTKSFPADLAAFIEEILNGKLHFLCSVLYSKTLCMSKCSNVHF